MRHARPAISLSATSFAASSHDPCLASPPAPAAAQTPEQFYQGRKMDMVIGYSAGGTYDLYARLVARNLANYMAGNPTIVPRNMPGGGSRTAVAWLVNVAPKDGSVLDDGRPVAGDRPGAGRPADPLRRRRSSITSAIPRARTTRPPRGTRRASRPSRTRCRRKSPWARRAAPRRRNIRRR